jgi:hypothetical protein
VSRFSQVLHIAFVERFVMRRTWWICVVLLGFLAPDSEAQQLANPKWDVGASVGLLSASPSPADEPYGGEWYFEGRYAVSIGHYWTEHLKTEVEFATSGEGERYIQRYSSVPGAPPFSYPYTVHESHTLRQVSGRLVWQFFDNAWVHPYVFGGVVYDADRVASYVPPQYYHPDPRNPSSPTVLAPAAHSGPETMHRIGATAGFGAKVYMTRNAFFNTAFVVSQANPARTASILGGFGIDF